MGKTEAIVFHLNGAMNGIWGQSQRERVEGWIDAHSNIRIYNIVVYFPSKKVFFRDTSRLLAHSKLFDQEVLH
jgi:hypothetical protein